MHDGLEGGAGLGIQEASQAGKVPIVAAPRAVGPGKLDDRPVAKPERCGGVPGGPGPPTFVLHRHSRVQYTGRWGWGSDNPSGQGDTLLNNGVAKKNGCFGVV